VAELSLAERSSGPRLRTKGFTPQPYKLGGGPDARRIARGLPGGPSQAPGPKSWLTRPQDPCTSLTPGSPSAHATPALVAHTQGGITLSLEEGELDADFC
jgi:hypothetical protein